MNNIPEQYPVLHGTHASLTGARKIAVIIIVVCLGISALVGIGILFQGQSSELQGRIISTTLIFAMYSGIFLIIISLFERIGPFAFWLIFIAGTVAITMMLILIWFQLPATVTVEQAHMYWDVSARIIGVSGVLTIYFLHSTMLFLMKSRSHISIRVTMLLTFLFGTFIAVWLILLVFEVEAVNNETMVRLIAASTILVVLGTILLPMLGRLIHEQHVHNRIISIDLPAGVLQRIRKHAQEENLSVPEFIGEVLEYYERGDRSQVPTTSQINVEQIFNEIEEGH